MFYKENSVKNVRGVLFQVFFKCHSIDCFSSFHYFYNFLTGLKMLTNPDEITSKKTGKDVIKQEGTFLNRKRCSKIGNHRKKIVILPFRPASYPRFWQKIVIVPSPIPFLIWQAFPACPVPWQYFEPFPLSLFVQIKIMSWFPSMFNMNQELLIANCVKKQTSYALLLLLLWTWSLIIIFVLLVSSYFAAQFLIYCFVYLYTLHLVFLHFSGKSYYVPSDQSRNSILYKN